MDSLTQIVLGASVGEAVLGKKVGNKAILWGAIGGTIPDLDVFCNFFVNDVRGMELHRGFSHSLLFSILFAPVFGFLISKIHNKLDVGWKSWTWLMFLALFTHPLLDCFTAYGTQLFWPFNYRIAYQNISVVDPTYTIPFLIIMIVLMFFRRDNPKRTRLNYIALGISSFYMLCTIFLKMYAHSQFEDALEKQNIEYSQMDSKPTPFNTFLWMSNVETKDSILLGMYSVFDPDNDIQFISYAKNRHLLKEFDSNESVQTLKRLSCGWYVAEQRGDTIWHHDLRFGQVGFEKNTSKFVYSFQIKKEEDGTVNITQRDRPSGDIRAAMGKMISRIWIKPKKMTN